MLGIYTGICKVPRFTNETGIPPRPTNDAYLFQHVTGFTRHRSGQRSSLLDLVFTFDINFIQFVQHHSPLGSSDHDCLTWQYECLFDNPTAESLHVLTTTGKEITWLCVKNLMKLIGTCYSAMILLILIGTSLRKRLRLLSINTFQKLLKKFHQINLHGGLAHLQK